MTPQQTTMMSMLRAGPVCGSEFYAAYIGRFNARVLELRQMGYLIEKRPCKYAHHGHTSNAFLYELEETDQLRLSV